MFGVPAMFQFIQQHPDFNVARLATLRTLVCGGAPCPEPLLRFFNDLGVTMQQGYGLTETAPWVSLLDARDSLKKLGSVGKPTISVDLQILDQNGAAVTPGAVGEICVRGANIFAGYWGMPQATDEAIRDGWFHTGDLGLVDADGFVFVCDRMKDMYISGGENVYPAEVESVLFRHPAIAEVAVVGAQGARWGEVGVAFVVLKSGETLDLDELQALAGESLAKFKVPAYLVELDTLPRTSSGKVQKQDLRSLWAERVPAINVTNSASRLNTLEARD